MMILRPWNSMSRWLSRLFAFLLFPWGEIAGRARGHKNALQLYTALLGWGKHSGVPHLLSETPTEYGLRLKNQFPAVRKEVLSIIEAFNEEVYGEVILDEHQMAIAYCAWRRLRRPSHWPFRLKTWFFRLATKERRGVADVHRCARIPHRFQKNPIIQGLPDILPSPSPGLG